MSDPVFVVLRAQGDTVQTVGPAGQAFTSFKEADAFAKQMRDRYTQQTFYLCQAIAVYEIQGRAMVKKVALPEPPEQEQRKTAKGKAAKTGEAAESHPPNVYRMPTRARAGE